MKVLLDTSPINNAHAIRGVGMYTRLLLESLQSRPDVEILRSSSSQPDIIHYPFFDLFFPTLPLHRPAKTVVTVHDVIPLLFPKFYKPGKRGQLMFYRQRFALQHVDAVITDSQASKKDIQKYLGIRENKIHVVYLAANPEIQKATSTQIEEVRKKYDLPKKYVLYVGDINYNKNIPELMKSVKFFPSDMHLVCVGKNFHPHRISEWQWIETQIAMSDVGNSVHFLTDIPGDATADLSAIYSGSIAYIQPSFYEGFGLTVLEAMQCHTPVICTQNSSLIEVGGEYVEFTEPTAEHIAAQVKNILEWSPTRRTERIKKAYQWSQHFAWEKVASETCTVYRSLITHE